MSSYISTTLVFYEKKLLAEVLEPLFSNSFFTPITLACRGGLNWFVGGYTLERILYGYNWRSRMEVPKSVTLFKGQESEGQAYLKSMAAKMSQESEPLKDSISPFEVIDPDYDLTYVPNVSLDVHVLAELKEWLATYPLHEFELQGALKLAVDGENELYRERAYQFLWSDYFNKIHTSPFIELHVSSGSPRLPERVNVSVDAHSAVWVKAGTSYKPKIDELAAEKNLVGLASIVKDIYHTDLVKWEQITLRLKGRIFWEETDRFVEAFSGIEPLELDID